jgi:DNA topoisomerase-3
MFKEKAFPTQFLRARFSSITKFDIRKAYEEMNTEPNLNESISVDARQIIDLKIGVAFSRFQTLYFTQKFADLMQKKITFGPCQTPTLGFCVKREDEIKTFVPKTFYRPVPVILMNNGKDYNLEWEGQHSFEEVE